MVAALGGVSPACAAKVSGAGGAPIAKNLPSAAAVAGPVHPCCAVAPLVEDEREVREAPRGASRAVPSEAERREAEEALSRHAAAEDWPAAWRVVDRFLGVHPDDALMLYNGACVQSRLGDLDRAFELLNRAIDRGFGDLGSAAGDPDLAPLRDDPRWRHVRARLAGTRSPADRRVSAGEDAFDAWKKKYGERRYTYITDDSRRLRLALALDETSRRQMLQMLDRQGDWMVRELFGEVQNDPVLLAIPHPLDFKDFFDGPNTAGVYEHRHRRLISRDTGASLRHEFVHLLHWGHMDRLRQVHPVWIQEGLASLFEDYEWGDDGSPVFRPNIRHNLARRAAMAGNAPPWPRFFSLGHAAFMDKAELNYALARSIFEFVADRGKLAVFYRMYTEGFERDPTGLRAMEEAFGRPASEVEREWRRWVASRGAIKDSVSPTDPIMGLMAENSNDGVRITRILRRSSADQAGLRIGDIITSVAGEPVRSLEELVIVLGRQRSGEPIEVGYRRRGEYRTAMLVERQGRPPLAP